MKRALLLAIVVLGASAAFASEPMKTNSVAVGGSFLQDSSVRKGISSSGFAAGFVYGLPQLKCPLSPEKGKLGVNIDYLGSSGKGARFSSVGLTAGSRITLDSGTGATSTYAGFGVGLYSNSFKRNVTVQNGESTTTVSKTSNKTNFGGKLLVGVNAKEGYFAELAYHLVGKVSGARGDTLAVTIGTHF